MKNVVEYQVSSMKTHPHIKKVQILANRLLQVIYYPKTLKSAFANFQYRIKLELPQNYPENPPIVKFIDPIDHMNVCTKTGEIKMPLLSQDWSSYFTLYIIIDLIDTLLVEPQTDEKYCPNRKTRESSEKLLFYSKYSKKDQMNQISIRNSNRKSVAESIQENQSEILETARPIQTMKNKLKRMKTIILQKAEDNEDDSKPVGGLKGKNQNQRTELSKINKLSKISEQFHMENSRVHMQNSGQLFQSQEQPRTTVKTTQSSKGAFFIPRSYSKHIIDSGQGFITRNKDIQILQKTKITPKQFKKDKIRIPTLRRDTIDEQLIDVLHKDIVKTTTLEQNSHQLQKINKMITAFQSQYEELMARRSKTKCNQLAQILEKKLRQQLTMIQELNELSLCIKKKMLRDVKSYVTK